MDENAMSQVCKAWVGYLEGFSDCYLRPSLTGGSVRGRPRPDWVVAHNGFAGVFEAKPDKGDFRNSLKPSTTHLSNVTDQALLHLVDSPERKFVSPTSKKELPLMYAVSIIYLGLRGVQENLMPYAMGENGVLAKINYINSSGEFVTFDPTIPRRIMLSEFSGQLEQVVEILSGGKKPLPSPSHVTGQGPKLLPVPKRLAELVRELDGSYYQISSLSGNLVMRLEKDGYTHNGSSRPMYYLVDKNGNPVHNHINPSYLLQISARKGQGGEVDENGNPV